MEKENPRKLNHYGFAKEIFSLINMKVIRGI